MTSIRHIASPYRVANDVLLDAALACVLANGVRRTTLSEVARAAGVSRMTLYRRFPDMSGVLAALITREFGTILTEAERAAAGEPAARGRLVAAAVHAVRALSANPLLRSVLDRDAALLSPYLTERIGTSQRMAEEFLRAQLAAGQRDGTIRAADPVLQARAIFLLLLPYVVAVRPATTDLSPDDLMTELARLLDAALRPEPA